MRPGPSDRHAPANGPRCARQPRPSATKQCSQTGKTPSDAAFTTDDEHGDTPPSQHSGAARANRGADCFHNWPTDTALLTADRRHPCLITPLTCATDTSIRCNARAAVPAQAGRLAGARGGLLRHTPVAASTAGACPERRSGPPAGHFQPGPAPAAGSGFTKIGVFPVRLDQKGARGFLKPPGSGASTFPATRAPWSAFW